MNLSFGHIELFVADPMAALAFYQTSLGAKLVDNQADTYIWIMIGAQEILLRPGRPPNASDSYKQTRAAFVLYTDDLETAVLQLQKNGVTFITQPDEADCFFFQDLDGNWFQLVNPAEH